MQKQCCLENSSNNLYFVELLVYTVLEWMKLYINNSKEFMKFINPKS